MLIRLKFTISLSWQRSISKISNSKESFNRESCPILIKTRISDSLTEVNAIEDVNLNESHQRNTEVLESGEK